MKRRDVAYFRQRQKNRVFTALIEFFAEEAQRRGITKKQLAETLSKDPAQISRWLSAPSNFELDTLSDILLALDAEMDHRVIRFADRAKPNYAHPLIAKHMGQQTLHSSSVVTQVSSTTAASSQTKISRKPDNVRVDVMVTTAS